MKKICNLLHTIIVDSVILIFYSFQDHLFEEEKIAGNRNGTVYRDIFAEFMHLRLTKHRCKQNYSLV